MADIEDIAEFNRQGWNAKAEGDDRWSIPVNAETIAAVLGKSVAAIYSLEVRALAAMRRLLVPEPQPEVE